MPEEIRLLSIVTRMNVGGPAVQISTLMRGFPAAHVRQILLTGSVGSDEQDFLDQQGTDLKFVRIPGMGREVSPTRDPAALASIASQIRAFDPHVIHTHTAKAGTLGRTAAILTRSKAKRVHTFHGHLLHGYFGATTTRGVITVERILARHTDRLIAVGATVREDLLDAGIGKREQYRVVPPGLQLGELPAKGDARADLGLRPEDAVVCFIGRLTPIKRIDRLIEVVRIMQARVPNVKFVVAGEGTEFPLLQEAIAAEGLPILALGWRSDVERILAASDAMVLTSDNEGTPVSLIQAGLAGIPAVSTDVGSVSDVVTDGKSGLLTSTDPQDIADALTRLLEDAQLRSEFAAFSTESYGERYGAHTLVSSHVEIYRELLEGR